MNRRTFVKLGTGLPVALSLLPLSSTVHPVMAASYDREAAARYAQEWGKRRNKAYPSLKNDCTNFASQVAIAGGMHMQGGPSLANEIPGGDESLDIWYAKKALFGRWFFSHTWTQVDSFRLYMQTEASALVSVYDMERDLSALRRNAELGDFVQVIKKEPYARSHLIEALHTCIVCDRGSDELYLASHTSDYTRDSLKEVVSRCDASSEMLALIHMP